jgi:nucleoside-diphosphate-sugar epimerase
LNSFFITGFNGFIGKHLITYFPTDFLFVKYDKTSPVNIQGEVVLHFAGKAHDLKNTSDSREYYQVNTELTKEIFKAFLLSDAKIILNILI